MPKTAAERQAAWRDRRARLITTLQAEHGRLRAELADVRGQLAGALAEAEHLATQQYKHPAAAVDDRSGRPFGCNTPVVQNGLDREWMAKPSPERPRRYAFFTVESPDPAAANAEHHTAALLDYGRGGNTASSVIEQSVASLPP